MASFIKYPLITITYW